MERRLVYRRLSTLSITRQSSLSAAVLLSSQIFAKQKEIQQKGAEETETRSAGELCYLCALLFKKDI